MIRIKDRYFKLEIEYKNIKNLYLRVKDSQTLFITCSKRVSRDDIIRFIHSKEDWIIAAIDKQDYRKANSYLVIDDTIYYRGKRYKLILLKGSNQVVIHDNEIVIYTKDQDIQRAMDLFYTKAKDILEKEIAIYEDKYQMILNNYGYHMVPEYRFRMMKAKWGVCYPEKNLITLNPLLIHFPKECFESVLWHEILHFIIPNHSKRFHDVLLMYMPKYKEYQKIMF